MNDDHLTPKWLIEALEKEFGKFDLDPCASTQYKNQFAKHNYQHSKGDNYADGLKENWFGKVFVNPPYSQGNIPKWIEKAHNEFYLRENCRLIIMLLPADTSTRWFHEHFCDLMIHDKYVSYTIRDFWRENIRFLNRINFSNSKNNAKFPSMLVIFQ